LLSALMIGISLTQKQEADPKAIALSNKLFKTTTEFNISAGVIVAILCVIYYVFW
jgi:hypothetical protein